MKRHSALARIGRKTNLAKKQKIAEEGTAQQARSKAQLEWGDIWMLYNAVATRHAQNGNCDPDSIYELVIAATNEQGQYLDIDPTQALV